MRGVSVIILLAFDVQPRAQQANVTSETQESMVKLVDRLVSKIFYKPTNRLSLQGDQGDLDIATLGKPSHLSTSHHSWRGLAYPYTRQYGAWYALQWRLLSPSCPVSHVRGSSLWGGQLQPIQKSVEHRAPDQKTLRQVVQFAEAESAAGSKEELLLPPVDIVTGTVTLPGSKSLSNRALLLASLSTGTTVIENVLDSEDIRYMIGALKQLGVRLDESARLSANRVVVQGKGGAFDISSCGSPCKLNLGNAGTAMRPLVAVLAASHGNFILDGTERMRERPIQDLIDGLDQLGSSVTCTENPPHGGCPPVSLDAKGLSGGVCRVSGKISSQYLSALLMASPLAKGNVTIEVKDELISKPYVDMTVGLMRKFGVVVEEEELSSDPGKPRPRFKIAGGQRYKSPRSCLVEGDASSASYFLGAAAIVGGPVTVIGCGLESVQGDTKFADVLEKMGATVEWSPTSITVSRKTDGTQPLRGVDVDCGGIPDAAMTLATVALFVDDNRPTAIRNVYSWRVKETERMKAIVTELRKLGATVEEGRDYCIVQPLAKPRANVGIDTYKDHRMAMAFSLVACAGVPVIIKDPKCVAKTFPTYFDELQALFDLDTDMTET